MYKTKKMFKKLNVFKKYIYYKSIKFIKILSAYNESPSICN